MGGLTAHLSDFGLLADRDVSLKTEYLTDFNQGGRHFRECD